jgi:hypothetical protein
MGGVMLLLIPVPMDWTPPPLKVEPGTPAIPSAAFAPADALAVPE